MFMRFRHGVLVGLAVGYYLGTKAGRDRYVQIERSLARIRSSNSYQQVVASACELTDLMIQRTRSLVEGSGDEPYGDPGPFELVGDPTLN
jgi:hypothetical protein